MKELIFKNSLMRYLKQGIEKVSRGKLSVLPSNTKWGLSIGIAENIEHCEGDSSFVAVRI